MAKGMRKRDIERALRRSNCTGPVGSGRGGHDKWRCPCGRHIAAVPRHNDISAGVVRDIARSMACLPEGWLQ